MSTVETFTASFGSLAVTCFLCLMQVKMGRVYHENPPQKFPQGQGGYGQQGGFGQGGFGGRGGMGGRYTGQVLQPLPLSPAGTTVLAANSTISSVCIAARSSSCGCAAGLAAAEAASNSSRAASWAAEADLAASEWAVWAMAAAMAWTRAMAVGIDAECSLTSACQSFQCDTFELHVQSTR